MTSDHELSRRSFLSLAGAGAAVTAVRGVGGPGPGAGTTAGSDLEEASIPELQKLMFLGLLSGAELTAYYLERIRELNPRLGAVIETNPDALRIARSRDGERRSGRWRGPLHGIPVLLKDNIATDDRMETTAGSLALAGSKVPADASVTALLRQAGAVVLGKANMSEWANMRGGDGKHPVVHGWSARGGFTRNPYRLDAETSGSSSGSAVAVAANMCAVAVGTETDGSITSPASMNNVVGLKPTIGLVPQRGIIPIAASQDCAGPMGRTVTDVALLLGAMQAPTATAGLRPPADVPRSYLRFLRAGALRGARIGVDPQYVDPVAQGFTGDDRMLLDIGEALEALRWAGAAVITDVDTGSAEKFYGDEYIVMLYELKDGVENYLAGLRNTRMRTLGDLIAFNLKHCDRELRYFGQTDFDFAEVLGGDLTDAAYRTALRRCRRLTRGQGLDRAFAKHRLDALLGPSYGYISSPAAVAGYPHVALPAGFDRLGRPHGVSLVGRPWQDGALLGLAYALEQELGARRTPGLEGSAPPRPKRFPCP